MAALNLRQNSRTVTRAAGQAASIRGLSRVPRRRPNTVRSQVMRHYLHTDEIDRLLAAAKRSPRYGRRNHLMVLLAFRHALRISEVIDLRTSDVDLDAGRLYCRRLKGSVSNTHPMEGDEIRAMRR